MKQLRNKEIKELIQNIKQRFELEYTKKDQFVVDDTIILINANADFFYYKNDILPTCKLLLKKIVLPTVTVDMGAVKFVVNGADIMRPGITNIDDQIQKDHAVAIIDETHGKPLAVGLSLMDAQEMQATTSGKVIKNLHWVGDSIWNK